METLHRITWALRKARLPVSIDGLVLDVGAGSCPYPRADVLLERFVAGDHRCGNGLVRDRPLVLGDAERMPFADKTFDYIVASHVLEHVKNPEVFLRELMRVGKAGYIETPNVFLERISPYSVHVLELMNVNDTLVIHKKVAPVPDPYLAELNLAHRHPAWRKLFYGVPQLFHMRYFWTETIRYHIVNPDERCDWAPEETSGDEAGVLTTYPGSGWRTMGLRALRRYYAWRRPKPIDWLTLLACPSCQKRLERHSTWFVCNTCALRYPAEPTPDFLRPEPLRGAASA